MREREEKNRIEILKRKKRRGEEESRVAEKGREEVAHLAMENFRRERERRKMTKTMKVEGKKKEGEICEREREMNWRRRRKERGKRKKMLSSSSLRTHAWGEEEEAPLHV